MQEVTANIAAVKDIKVDAAVAAVLYKKKKLPGIVTIKEELDGKDRTERKAFLCGKMVPLYFTLPWLMLQCGQCASPQGSGITALWFNASNITAKPALNTCYLAYLGLKMSLTSFKCDRQKIQLIIYHVFFEPPPPPLINTFYGFFTRRMCKFISFWKRPISNARLFFWFRLGCTNQVRLKR